MNFGKEASGAARQPLRSCPEVLEMRELREHRPLGTVGRDALDARLMVTQRTIQCLVLVLVLVSVRSGLPAAGDMKMCFCWQEYMEALMNRTQRLEEMEVKEPGPALETLRTTEPSWSLAAVGPVLARTPSGECDPTKSSSCTLVMLP